ncbi:MAG TPA: DUF4270 family protein [Mucilaginibacter sp.]|nr:DUF4270 family protein [Mucilaginibacter sp.]
MNSCRNNATIGLPAPSTQLNGNLIDTSTVIVNTVTDAGFLAPGITPTDSIITSGLAKTPMGLFRDPVMGTVQSDIAIGLTLPGGTAYTLPTGTVVIDSAVLALKYADGFYGDSLTSKFKVNVYQLGSRPVNKTYYNTTDFSKNLGPLIGTRTFYARTHDSVRVYNIITGSPDTLWKVAPQLRIPINTNFINNFLFNASADMLGSNTVFQNVVKGLYITMDQPGTQGAGGTFMFKLTDSLNVYYHTINGTTIDTASVALPLSQAHAAHIMRTPSSAVTSAIAHNSPNNVIYLQGLAGLRAKISFPYLKSLLTTLGSNIVLNRAELVVTPMQGTTIPFSAQPKLTMYRYDLARTPVEVEDASTSDGRAGGIGVFGGYYNRVKNEYHFIITGYIEDLMNGYSVDYGTYLATIDTTNTSTVDINPTPQTAGRTVAIGTVTDKSSPYYASRIKLNLIYTKTSK